MVEIEKEYAFEGPDGKASLPDLFGERRQLIVYHIMFAPGVHGWPPERPHETRATRAKKTSR